MASSKQCSIKIIHTACDGKGATITIVRSTNGYIFGGYNPVSWSSPDSFTSETAPGAFLFSLTNPAGTDPVKYLLEDPTKAAVRSHRKFGPMFGDRPGHVDLCCSFWDGISCTAFPSSYVDTTGRGNATFTGAYSFTTEKMEVWSVLPNDS